RNGRPPLPLDAPETPPGLARHERRAGVRLQRPRARRQDRSLHDPRVPLRRARPCPPGDVGGHPRARQHVDPRRGAGAGAREEVSVPDGVGLTLGGFVRDIAARWGPRPALVFEGRSWTYSELESEVRRVARAL